MNIITYQCCLIILITNSNLLSMFGFGRELRFYPHQLKEMHRQEYTIKNNETKHPRELTIQTQHKEQIQKDEKIHKNKNT